MHDLFGTHEKKRPAKAWYCSGLLVAALLPAVAAIGCTSGSVGQGGSPFGRNVPPAEPLPEPTPTPTPVTPAPVVMPAPVPVTPAPVVMPPANPIPTAPVPPPPPPLPPPLPPSSVKVSQIEMPPAIYNLLQARCSMCHTYGARDPAGWGSVLDVSRMIAADIVVPGNLDQSRLWNRVAVRADMPFNGTRLTGAELGLLRGWILNLPRTFTRARSNEAILDLMVADLASSGNRADTRYISFAHYVDEHRSPEELKAARAALNVIINSVSRETALVQPVPIDPEQSIFRFSLNALGWDNDTWNRLTSFYPYCLRSNQAPHRTMYNRLATEAPFVRGDWFLATVMRPPLYYDLLQLGDNLDDFALAELNVDINANIDASRIQRIGFRSSGVSLHNRVFERHAARNDGYLWVSYDFDTDVGTGDIRANPLGPTNRNNQFQHSFQNLAGEMIFSLPNGMQGYLLADANGARLDKAVQTVVRDLRRPDGSVEDGISCVGCHGVTGMNQPRIFDEIPSYVAAHQGDFSAAERAEIGRIYPTNGQMLLQTDATAYLSKLRTLMGDLLPSTGVVEYDDFIGLYGQYEAKVGLRAGTIELQADPATVTREVTSRADNEGDLPLTITDPLVTRDDWTCRYRRIIRDVRAATFCTNTFDAPEVVDFCLNR